MGIILSSASGGSDPFASLDGRSGATGASPQLPNILNTFHPSGPADGRYFWPSTSAFKSATGNYQQPQWRVAGVDYAVGLVSNCTVDTGTGIITEAGSSPVNGQKKSLRTVNGGSLPTVNGSGISQGTSYFIVNASGSTYKLSLTSGGAAVTFGGSPSGVVALKMPSTTLMPPGVTNGGGTISINGSANVTNGSQSTTAQINLIGWDLAEQYVYCTYGSNKTVIQNCYFSSISSGTVPLQTDPPCNSLDVRYCEFNNGGVQNTGSSSTGGVKYVMSLLGASGTVEYNYIYNVSTEVIAHASNSTMQYNLITDCGYGADVDHLEMISGQPGYSNYTLRFNTFYNPPATGGYPKEMNTGMIFFQTPAAVTSTNIVCDNNTIIGLGPNTHRSSDGVSNHPAYNMGIYFTTGNGGSSTNNCFVRNNYLNSSSMETLGLMIFYEGGGAITGMTTSGNVSLDTAATVSQGVTGPQ